MSQRSYFVPELLEKMKALPDADLDELHMGLTDYVVKWCVEIVLEANTKNRLANKNLKQNNIDEAIKYYKQVLALWDDYGSNHNLACCYHMKGRYQLAEQCFSRSLQIKNRASSHCDYALLLWHLGRFEEAIVHCYAAIEWKNDDSSLMYTMGERHFLGECLQIHISAESELKIDTEIMVYYLLCECYGAT